MPRDRAAPRRRAPSPASNFAGAVAQRRHAARLTLAELARRSGVSRAMLSEVERGRKSPTIRDACRIAEVLQCTVSELLREPAPTRLAIVRRRERRRLTDRSARVERYVLSDVMTARGLEVVWYV